MFVLRALVRNVRFCAANIVVRECVLAENTGIDGTSVQHRVLTSVVLHESISTKQQRVLHGVSSDYVGPNC